MSTVSVHVVTFNSQAFIIRCLNEVLQQTVRPERIVVIDNGSTDETRQILTAENLHDAGIEVIYNDRNTGFAGAQNQALKHCETDYFLVLNPDVRLEDDYIQCLMDFMDERRDVGSVTGLLLRPGQVGQLDSAGLGITRSRRAFDRRTLTPGNSALEPEQVFGVSGAAGLYRRSMAAEISINGQFYDESFFAYKEDVDVAWRSRLAGWKSYCVPRARAEHNRGWKDGSRRKQPRWIRQLSYVNRYKMMIKNDKVLYLVRDTLYLLPYEVASLVYVVMTEPFLLATWPRLWADWQSLIAARRSVQALRQASWSDIYRYFEQS